MSVKRCIQKWLGIGVYERMPPAAPVITSMCPFRDGALIGARDGKLYHVSYDVHTNSPVVARVIQLTSD